MGISIVLSIRTYIEWFRWNVAEQRYIVESLVLVIWTEKYDEIFSRKSSFYSSRIVSKYIWHLMKNRADMWAEMITYFPTGNEYLRN